MLQMDSIRGNDSTGVFGISKSGEIDILKGNANGWTFTQCAEYEKFGRKLINDYRIVIGHNRKATQGAITVKNAHPFTQKHITLVHNGTIFNSKELNTKAEVDSEAIAVELANNTVAETLKKLNGAFALVWFNKTDNTLSVVRNSQRTLYYLKYDDIWILSSEIGLPLWLQGRDNHKAEDWKECPTDKILTFPLNNLEEDPIEVPYEKYASPTIFQQYEFPHKHTHSPVQTNPQSLKYGDIVKFIVNSYNHEEIGPSLIGHPVFDNEMDTNMIVHVGLPKNDKVEDYLSQGELFTATVQYIRPIGGRNVIFAQNPAICKMWKDLNGEENETAEIIEAIKDGCGVCKNAMVFQDANKSVIQKRKNGSWRLRCKTCVETAFNNSVKKKQIIDVSSNNVQ